MFYRGTVTLTLEEHGVKDIQNKDRLSSALESAMKQAANEHLAVPHRQLQGVH